MARSCPKCGGALAIPHPHPQKVVCPKCQASIAIATGVKIPPSVGLPSPIPSPTAVSPPESPLSLPPASTRQTRQRLAAILVVTGLGVLFVGGIATAIVLWHREGVESKQEEAFSPVRDAIRVEQLPEEPPPLDPRIASVQPAVDKGVAFLKAKMAVLRKQNLYNSGYAIFPRQVILPGFAGLIGLTLLECGVPPDDPVILQVAEILRAEAPRMDKNYVLSSALFFLNRWDESLPLGLEEKDRALARSFALRIIAGQWSSGVWDYNAVLLTPKQEADLLASLQQGAYKPQKLKRPFYSISNTQFVMLALWGARRHGVPVRDVLLATAEFFNANQADDGHWIYSTVEPNRLWTSSTCAGLIALAIEKALREDSEFVTKVQPTVAAKKRADANRAFAYVAQSIGRRKGDPGMTSTYSGTIFQADAWGDLYFLWCLERLGVIYGKDRIGGKDWYEWGYPIVLKAQRADGSWQDRHDPLIDSCFALLFLKRANIAKDLTIMLRKQLMDNRPNSPRGHASPRVQEKR
jgi:hypothetical protein